MRRASASVASWNCRGSGAAVPPSVCGVPRRSTLGTLSQLSGVPVSSSLHRRRRARSSGSRSYRRGTIVRSHALST